VKKTALFGLITILICFISSNTVLADLSDGLVAYYPFDGSTKDVSGNDLDGIVIDGGFTKNRFNKNNSALSGYVEVPDNDMLDIVDAFTLTAWLKMEAVGSAFNCWIGKDYTTAFGSGISSGGSGDCQVGDDINRPMRLYIGHQATYFSDATNFSCGDTWYHVAVTFNDTTDTVQLYVNGVIDAVKTHTGSLAQNDYPLGIGRDSRYSDEFSGVIDSVRIYNRELSSSEIEALFNITESTETQNSDGGGDSGCFVSAIK